MPNIPRGRDYYANGLGTPEQQIKNVLQCRKFLREVTDPQLTPRVPADIRKAALSLLKRWPRDEHMRKALTSEQTLEEAMAEDLEERRKRRADLGNVGNHWY